jgi:hypothetical protein
MTIGRTQKTETATDWRAPNHVASRLPTLLGLTSFVFKVPEETISWCLTVHYTYSLSAPPGPFTRAPRQTLSPHPEQLSLSRCGAHSRGRSTLGVSTFCHIRCGPANRIFPHGTEWKNGIRDALVDLTINCFSRLPELDPPKSPSHRVTLWTVRGSCLDRSVKRPRDHPLPGRPAFFLNGS